MQTRDLIHRPLVDWPSRSTRRSVRVPAYDELISPVRNAILRARRAIENAQQPDGTWQAANHGSSYFASQLVLLLAFLEDECSDLAEQAAAAIRMDQHQDGTWSRTSDGPADVSASVTAYFALKILGDSATESHMRTARQAIRDLGGADASDEETRLWLALLGQIDFQHCEPNAPEWVVLPTTWQRRIFGGRVSERTKRILMAKSVIWARRPFRKIELARGVRELFVETPDKWRATTARRARWSQVWNALIQCAERAELRPLRDRALAQVSAEVVRQAREAETGGFDFTRVAWDIVALHALGQGGSSVFKACEARLEQLLIVDEWDAVRPCIRTHARLDTARALTALTASGISATHPALANGAASLVDWFRPAHASSKCIDGSDLTEVLTALTELSQGPQVVDGALPPNIQLSRDRVARFLARRRHRDFPRDETHTLVGTLRQALTARLHGSETPRQLGSALEALSLASKLSVCRAAECGAARLRHKQNADGSWSETHDVSAICSTAWAIRGLIAAGVAVDDQTVAAGLNWLFVHQEDDGSWGNATQTSTVVLSLVAAGIALSDATCRAVKSLLNDQDCDGDHNFDLYETAAVLEAFSRWSVAAATQHADSPPVELRLVGNLALTE